MLKRIISEFRSALSNVASKGVLVISHPRNHESALPEGCPRSFCVRGKEQKGKSSTATSSAMPWKSADWKPVLELGSSIVMPTGGVPELPSAPAWSTASSALERVTELYLGVPEIRPIRADFPKCFRKEQQHYQKSQDVKLHF